MGGGRGGGGGCWRDGRGGRAHGSITHSTVQEAFLSM
jgi:hypothetical protein